MSDTEHPNRHCLQLGKSTLQPTHTLATLQAPMLMLQQDFLIETQHVTQPFSDLSAWQLSQGLFWACKAALQALGELPAHRGRCSGSMGTSSIGCMLSRVFWITMLDLWTCILFRSYSRPKCPLMHPLMQLMWTGPGWGSVHAGEA